MFFDKAPESTFGGFVFLGGNDNPLAADVCYINMVLFQ